VQRGGVGVAIALIGTLAFGGCSFVLVERAPTRDRWPEDNRWGLGLNRCTSSPVVPIVDGTITLGLFSGAAYVASRPSEAGVSLYEAGLLFIPGMVFLISSLYGLIATSTCRSYLAGPPYEPYAR
jgi:hypothetical protein